LKAPAGPMPFLGLSRTTAPNVVVEATSESGVPLKVTDPPTLTRPFRLRGCGGRHGDE
jgi:hypothetical protein